MHFRRTAAFTLLEMLVASTVLALLVGVIFQLLAAASGSSETTDKRLDADTHARRVFERMAQDFSRMCLQRNAEIVLAKNTADPSGATLNDKLFFYSQTAGVFSGGQEPATRFRSGVSLVGYRVHADPQGPLGLERMAKGLAWDGAPSANASGGIPFLTYPAASGSTVATTPVLDSTMLGRWPATMGTAPNHHGQDPDYRVLSENVFRLQICFQLKDGSVANQPINDAAGDTNNPSASRDPGPSDDQLARYLPGSRWFNKQHGRAFRCVSNTTAAAVWEPLGFDDVSSVIVTLAVFDSKTWRSLPRRTSLTSALPEASDTDLGNTPPLLPLVKWNRLIDTGAFAASAGIPPVRAGAARVYQRDFTLVSSP